MEELIKKIDDKIEEIKECTLANYQIKAPLFQNFLDKFDIENINENELQKIIILFENRNLPLEIFYSFSSFYQNAETAMQEELLSNGTNSEGVIEKIGFKCSLPKNFDEESLLEIKTALKENTARAIRKREEFTHEIRMAKKLCNELRSKNANEKSIQKAKNKTNSGLKTYKFYQEVKEYYKELLEENKKYAQQKRKLIKELKKTKEFVLGLPDYSKMDGISFFVLQELDENIYIDIFKQIFKYQKEKYDLLIEQKNTLLEDNLKNKYKELLKKYNIDYEKLEQDIKDVLNKCDNLNILDIKFNLLNIDNNIVLTEELLNSIIDMDIKQIRNLKHLMDSGIVTKNTICKNLDLINDDYDNFNNNAKIMMNHKISLDNKIYDEDILFINNQELLQNEKMLKVYRNELSKGDYTYLNDSNSFDILDVLIENNLPLDSFDNYSLNNKDISNLIKRLSICTDLDIDIYTVSGNLNRSFLLGNKFYIPEEALDEYIVTSNYYDENIINFIRNNNRNNINKNINLIEEFNELENYKSEDELSYNIDGLIISRPKVMRNLTLFLETENINDNNILQSIIYNSNFNDNDIEIIKSTIFKNNKVKVKE